MIGGVTDVGDLEDKSFNEAGWCGTLTGNDAVGGTAEVIVTESPEDYIANMETLIGEGFNIIVTFGNALTNDTLDTAMSTSSGSIRPSASMPRAPATPSQPLPTVTGTRTLQSSCPTPKASSSTRPSRVTWLVS
jgi:hypothetical protein